MSYIEAAFISRGSYDALEDQRLQGEELETSEIYVAMFALAGNADKREAAKLPLEFYDIAETGSGIYMASLAVFNSQGKPGRQCVGEFDDGYWTDVRQRLVIADVSIDHRYTPDHSYVRTYDPDMDADLKITRERVPVLA